MKVIHLLRCRTPSGPRRIGYTPVGARGFLALHLKAFDRSGTK